MICPICNENIDDGIKYCTSCGAEVAAFAGVTPDKIIVNQTPEQQQEMGDDSVTQLIPENYMTAEGDDSVTQLIPENYMTAKGDDSATMLLDPLDGKMPVNTQITYQQNIPVNNPAKKSNALPFFVIGGLVLLGIIALAILFI
ncbi:MAG: zinc ribbon domain-containing protein [Lachnospiraceae bacterium]|nr:zinc ribbon domain-containing protein [Lachnospiraceae bacterium]